MQIAIRIERVDSMDIAVNVCASCVARHYRRLAELGEVAEEGHRLVTLLCRHELAIAEALAAGESPTEALAAVGEARAELLAVVDSIPLVMGRGLAIAG